MIPKIENPAISKKKSHDGCEKSPGISAMKKYDWINPIRQNPILTISQIFHAAAGSVCIDTNNYFGCANVV